MASVDTLPFVVVDDANTDRIKYEGNWRQVNSNTLQTLSRLGDGGPPFRGLREITSDGSLTFTFSGRHVEIYGTNNVRQPVDPAVECIIDGQSSSPDVRVLVRNQARICQAYNLKEGQHQITMRTTTSTGKPLYFDFIQYAPDARANLDREYMKYDSSDPIITYSGDWGSLGGLHLRQTTQNGASAQVSFVGTSFVAVGAILNRNSPSTVTYSVDGGSEASVTIRPSDVNTIPSFGHKVVEINGLKPGRHTVKVTYRGTSDSTPLLFDYVAIQHEPPSPVQPAPPGQPNPNTPSSPSTPSNSISSGGPGASVAQTPRPTPSDIIYAPPPDTSLLSQPQPSGILSGAGADDPDSSALSVASKEGVPIGAIVGLVLGGLAILVVGFLIFYYIRRRTRKTQNLGYVDEVARPFNNSSPTNRPTTMSSFSATSESYQVSPLSAGTTSSSWQSPYTAFSHSDKLAAFSAQRNDEPVRRPMSQSTAVSLPPAYMHG